MAFDVYNVYRLKIREIVLYNVIGKVEIVLMRYEFIVKPYSIYEKLWTLKIYA